MDWISYDRIALAQAFATDSHPAHSLVGPTLRSYWINYPGVTHVRATLSWSVRPSLILTLSGDNLLNHQTGEPDNVTVLPGRTVTFGFRSDF
jgi:iron complex outermembrane receptor protein